MRGKKELAKELIKRAYEFGYFVGYKGHSDWAEWVRSTKEDLYAEASKLGIYELVRDAYARGRAEGAKKREEEIHLSLIEKGKIPEETEKLKIKPVEKLKQEVPEEELRKEEFARFLKQVKILTPPELLDSVKHLEFPKMLRGGE